MDIQTLEQFFMWCTIFSGGIFLYSAMMCAFAPDFIYRFQAKLFNVPRESFNVVVYAYLGLFKIVFIVFVLVPYIALAIMS